MNRFDARENRSHGAPDGALVNAALAAKYFRGTSPVGKRIVFQKRTVETVGIFGNVRSRSLCVAPTPEIYVPIEQWGWRGGTVFIRTIATRRMLSRASAQSCDSSTRRFHALTLAASLAV